MNGIAFDETEKGTKFDANFIAILNERSNNFEYYVQRLMGVGMENEEQPAHGKIWVPYINGKREDWSYLCDNNRIVAKEDEIIWRFEDPNLKKEEYTPEDPNTRHPSLIGAATKGQ